MPTLVEPLHAWRRVTHALLVLAVVALLLVDSWLLWRFSVDWPLHDDFTQILAIPGYLVQLDWKQKLALIFELSPEHRIASLRLAGWIGGALPSGMDFRVLIALGNAMGIVAGAIVIWSYPRALRLTAALLAALLLTSLTHYGAQYWATGALQHFGVSFYSIATLSLVACRRWQLLAIPLALTAAFTSANGLAVFPATVLLLLLERRPSAAIAWAIGGALFIALYFIGYAPPAGRPGIVAMLAEPLRLAGFVLATLGGVGVVFVASVVLGALIAAAWGWLIGTGAWRRVPPFVIAATFCIALSCAMIGVGRAELGADAVTLSRYRGYSGLAILLTFAALAWTIDARWLMRAALAGAAAQYAIAWGMYAPHMIDLSMMQSALRDHFAANEHGYYEAFTEKFGDFTLKRADEIGVYYGARKATAPVPFTPGTPPQESVSAIVDTRIYSGERAISVVGSIEGRHRHLDLWLEGQGSAFRAPLVTLRYRTRPGNRRTAFRGTLALASVPSGTYRVGFADAGITWTAREVSIR